MTHVWTSRHYNKPGDPKFCRASVYSREGGSYSWLHNYQCTRKPVVCREVNGEEYGFCKQHDPEAVKERDRIRREQWRKETEAKNREYDIAKQTREAMEACKKALEEIAAGHNDPRSLAAETLALFPRQDSQSVKKERPTAT
jgi:hypothetical protein